MFACISRLCCRSSPTKHTWWGPLWLADQTFHFTGACITGPVRADTALQHFGVGGHGRGLHGGLGRASSDVMVTTASSQQVTVANARLWSTIVNTLYVEGEGPNHRVMA